MEESERTGVSWRNKLFQGDNRRFRKYVRTSRIEGVNNIFVGRSKIRRSIWLLIFLAATGGCIYSVADRILYFMSKPSVTTVSVHMETNLDFPAVTICNINPVKKSFLKEMGLLDAFYDIVQNGTDNNKSLPLNGSDNDFYKLMYDGRQENFIVDCDYMGTKYGIENLTITYTQLGLCYTFNSGSDVLTTNGTGANHGLELVLNIAQEEYLENPNQAVGVKITIHPQGEPGEPENTGIAVPPGRTAYIGLRQKIVTDKSSRQICRATDDTAEFQFLGEELTYSVSACLLDCFFINIAESCNCTETGVWSPADSDKFSNLPDCGTDHIPCLLKQYYSPPYCKPRCPAACNYTTYGISTSYAAFLTKLQRNNITDVDSDNISVKIYFEDLNIEYTTTADVYGLVEMLSNIGGNMGLFLGAGVITMLELFVWIADEIKDRCCRVSEKKMARWVRNLRKKVTKRKSRRHNVSMETVESGADDYHTNYGEAETAFGNTHEYETFGRYPGEVKDISEDSEESEGE